MEGVRYLTDDAGNRTAVVLDLRRHRRLWEDVYDRRLIEARRAEPRVLLDVVRMRLAGRPANRPARAGHGRAIGMTGSATSRRRSTLPPCDTGVRRAVDPVEPPMG